MERLLFGAVVLGLQVGLALPGLAELGGEIRHGEVHGLVELVLDHGDLVGEIDHLGMALEVTLAEDGLVLAEVG